MRVLRFVCHVVVSLHDHFLTGIGVRQSVMVAKLLRADLLFSHHLARIGVQPPDTFFFFLERRLVCLMWFALVFLHTVPLRKTFCVNKEF